MRKRKKCQNVACSQFPDQWPPVAEQEMTQKAETWVGGGDQTSRLNSKYFSASLILQEKTFEQKYKSINSCESFTKQYIKMDNKLLHLHHPLVAGCNIDTTGGSGDASLVFIHSLRTFKCCVNEKVLQDSLPPPPPPDVEEQLQIEVLWDHWAPPGVVGRNLISADCVLDPIPSVSDRRREGQDEERPPESGSLLQLGSLVQRQEPRETGD